MCTIVLQIRISRYLKKGKGHSKCEFQLILDRVMTSRFAPVPFRVCKVCMIVELFIVLIAKKKVDKEKENKTLYVENTIFTYIHREEIARIESELISHHFHTGT